LYQEDLILVNDLSYTIALVFEARKLEKMLYDDLPEEIAHLFPMEDIVMPYIIRHLISAGWDVLDYSQQRELYQNMRIIQDLKQRTLVAVYELSKGMLNQHPEDIIY